MKKEYSTPQITMTEFQHRDMLEDSGDQNFDGTDNWGFDKFSS